MKYTLDDLKRMGYKKIGVNPRGECYEHIYEKKRIVLKKDTDGKYEWVGLW